MTLFIFDSGGSLVWQSQPSQANGAQAPQFSQNPFYADGQSTVSIASGSATFPWNGRANDGKLVSTGDYFVKAEIKQGGVMSVYSKVLTVIVQKHSSLSRVTLGPNPASSMLLFDISSVPQGLEVEIQVWNLAGELIRVFRATSAVQSKVVWDLSATDGRPLSDGIYVVVMLTQSSDSSLQDKHVIKFVVARR